MDELLLDIKKAKTIVDNRLDTNKDRVRFWQAIKKSLSYMQHCCKKELITLEDRKKTAYGAQLAHLFPGQEDNEDPDIIFLHIVNTKFQFEELPDLPFDAFRRLL